MRSITKQSIKAFMNAEPFKKSNMEVEVLPNVSIKQLRGEWYLNGKKNVGYETPDTSKFNEADHLAAAEVSEILKGCILGFSEFKNFKISKSGEVRVRFDYDYCADENPKGALGSFVGVGYLFLRTMLNGF